MIPPTAPALDAAFSYVQNDLGLIHLTRAFAEGPLKFALDTVANLLEGKNRWPHLGPIPWPAIAGPVAVMAYVLGGWRLALLAVVTCLWTALVGQWEQAMQTLSVIIVAAPLAMIAGLALGYLAWRTARVERLLHPLLALLQTLPFFTYLLPAVIFFKVGPTAGAMATFFYAIPPMILMTTLGLKKVSPDIVEAGKMSGANRLQMMTRVYLPVGDPPAHACAARHALVAQTPPSADRFGAFCRQLPDRLGRLGDEACRALVLAAVRREPPPVAHGCFRRGPPQRIPLAGPRDRQDHQGRPRKAPRARHHRCHARLS